MSTTTVNVQLEKTKQFIVAWQKSDSLNEVVKQLPGTPKDRLYALAYNLRKIGVPLKKFSKTSFLKENREALIALAKKV